MTDYVLIHGAWHGSWCWARVRRLLAAGAHRVFTPTLTGVGERSHLLSRDVGLGSGKIGDAEIDKILFGIEQAREAGSYLFLAPQFVVTAIR
jgi:hypothetical protein